MGESNVPGRVDIYGTPSGWERFIGGSTWFLKASWKAANIYLIGGGGRTRTYDLRIMRLPDKADSKENKQLSSEGNGKVRKNPQPPRNPETS